MSLPDDKSIFHDAELALVVPRCPDGLEFPAVGDEAAVEEWIGKLQRETERDCCFYDENLLYLCRLTYRNGNQVDDESLISFKRICDAIKITTQCSFIRRRATISGPSGQPSTSTATTNLGLPPVTPNPMPGMHAGYQQYAQAEGVQVWEGGLSGATALDQAAPECLVVREDGGLAAYWIGRVPLAFANVEVRDPLLAITCHATLRESSIVGGGRRMGAVEREDGNRRGGGEEMVTVGEIIGMRDVLAGLGGTSLPSSRLRQPGDQISEDPSTGSTPGSLSRPEPAMVLRKSYRTVLPLYSAITVKMRTLPTPLSQTTDTDDGESLTSTICIEVESGHGQPGLSFHVTNVRVSTRQTEGTRSSTDIVHLLANKDDAAGYFPFQLERFAQHNLVYNIKAEASSSTAGVQNQYLSASGKVEHLRIDVDGFATTLDEQKLTPEFTSTWNTVLELRNADLQSRVAYLKPISDPSSRVPQRPSSPPASARSRQSSIYPQAKKPPKVLHRDLVVSLNLIETGDRGTTTTSSSRDPSALNEVHLFDTIDAEVTILNVSGRTVRLVLSDLETPMNQTANASPGPATGRKRDNIAKGQSVFVKRSQGLLADYAIPPGPANQKPIIMLQNDLKLAPLLPRSCQSVRLRYMAMMSGAQRIPGLRLTDFERDQQVDLNFEMFLEVT